MRPDGSFLSQPIRSLQTMLRVLSEADPEHPAVIPDGIYGTETMQAVSHFQRHHGLPVTGITDQDTWDAIYRAYLPARIQILEAEPLTIILNPNEVILPGDRHPHMGVIQAVLELLSDAYGIPRPSRSGVLDRETADSIATFQYLAGLPATGNLDKQTWQQLALHYPMAANLLSNRPVSREEI